MPQIHGPIQHLRRSLGPGLQTIQAIHGPPTLGPVVVPVIGNRTRGPSPRKHGVGQRGNPSGEGNKQVGKIGLDGRKNGRPGSLGGSGRVQIKRGRGWSGLLLQRTTREAIRRKHPENFSKIRSRLLHGSSPGNLCSSVSYSHLKCTNLGCPISVFVLQGM